MLKHGNIGTLFSVAISVDDMPLFASVYCDVMIAMPPMPTRLVRER